MLFYTNKNPYIIKNDNTRRIRFGIHAVWSFIVDSIELWWKIRAVFVTPVLWNVKISYNNCVIITEKLYVLTKCCRTTSWTADKQCDVKRRPWVSRCSRDERQGWQEAGLRKLLAQKIQIKSRHAHKTVLTYSIVLRFFSFQTNQMDFGKLLFAYFWQFIHNDIRTKFAEINPFEEILVSGIKLQTWWILYQFVFRRNAVDFCIDNRRPCDAQIAIATYIILSNVYKSPVFRWIWCTCHR